MRKVILFITTSLDGFIARKNGDIDWLFTDQDYGYKAFIKDVDTVLMGGKTYRQIQSFGEWPYPDVHSYVFTRKVSKYQPEDDITFIHHEIEELVQKLKKQKGKNIWLVGGGEINSLLMEAKLIDEIHLYLHPVFLGSGIPVFNEYISDQWMKIHDIEEYDSGMVRLVYHRKDN